MRLRPRVVRGGQPHPAQQVLEPAVASQPIEQAAREAEYLEGFDCFGTEEFQEGYQAFLAKRKPEFKGK